MVPCDVVVGGVAVDDEPVVEDVDEPVVEGVDEPVVGGDAVDGELPSAQDI